MHESAIQLAKQQDGEIAATVSSTVSASQNVAIDPQRIRIISRLTPAESQPKLLAPSAAPVASTLPVVISFPTPTAVSPSLIKTGETFAHNLLSIQRIFLGQSGKAYVLVDLGGNRYVLPVGGRQLNRVIREERLKQGIKLRSNDLKEINESLQAYAEMAGITQEVWYRVAPIPGGGIEIDLGDVGQTRVRVTTGKVDILAEGSETLFYRTSISQPMAMPAEVGNLKLLEKYLNLQPVSSFMLIAWLTYTLAHPKLSTSKYVILVLNGHQGSGKSFLCNLILSLLDPNAAGIQMIPSNGKDLAIAAQNAHVLCYDNIRDVREAMADLFCVAATGGALSCRQLFTDADQQVTRLHAALVLNGIHSFVNQPDFDQRCLRLELRPIPEVTRKSETQLVEEFQADLPAILRGMFDRIAEIFTHLPAAEVTHPERMYDFSKWLAAMESVDGVPSGIYQQEYSALLNHGQRDTLLDNLLAAAVLEFAEDQFEGETWSGRPADLLTALNNLVSLGSQRSREWPDNPIALSKRLVPLRAALMSQGINVELHRGKHRTIAITKQGTK